MRTRHAKGDILPIYQKPITREDLEGTARLEQFIGALSDGVERWRVRFVAGNGYEEETYERIIAT